MKTSSSMFVPSLFALCLLLVLNSAGDQFSSVPREDFWLPGPGIVNAVAQADGVIYVGGGFQAVIPSPPSGVGAYDLNSGARDPDFPMVNGQVWAVISDGEGGWFIGGTFTAVGDAAVTNLAHVRQDKTVDSNWAPNPGGYINGTPVSSISALAISGNVLYVAGLFSNVGSQPRNAIAAIDIATGQATAWNPDPKDAESHLAIRSIAVSGQKVYVGGTFSSIGGQARNNLVALDATTGNATDWRPNPKGDYNHSGFEWIQQIIVSANSIYVGGTFTNIVDQARNTVAAFDEATGDLRPWDPNPSVDPINDPVYFSALAVCCDKVYVGGSFDQIGGQPRRDLACLDAATGLATPWDPNNQSDFGIGRGSESGASAMALVGDVLYVPGRIYTIPPPFFTQILSLDKNTGELKSWRVRPYGPVTSLAVQGSTLLAAENWLGTGSPQPGSLNRPILAAFDAMTGQPLDWSSELRFGSIEALAMTSEAVYFAGQGISFAGTPGNPGRSLNGLGAVDIRTGSLLPWSPQPAQIFEGALGDVWFRAIAPAGNAIYIGGQLIGAANSVGVVASLDLETGATNWVRRTDGSNEWESIASLAVSSGTVYVGGGFTSIGGVQRTNLAALDARTGTVTDWAPAQVTSAILTVVGDTVYAVGGDLFAVDALTGTVTPFNLAPNNGISGMAALNNVLYLAGQFTRIGGQDRSRLAAIDLSTGQLTDWNPGADRALAAPLMERFTLAVSDQALAVVGGFASIGGKNRSRFAVFPRSESPQLLNQPESQRLDVGQTARLSVQAIGAEPKQYQWSMNGTNIAGATDPALVLPSANVADSGGYSVQISNAAGVVQSRRATLTVVDPVRITVQPASQSVQPGVNGALQVVAAGSEPLQYQWRLNGVDIPAQVSSILTLNKVQPSNGGLYSVVVANAGGSVSSQTAEVTVLSPPLPLADNFADRGAVTGASGTGNGSNSHASLEPNEPPQTKPGGKSLWLTWRAPADGIAVFDTRGSALDTLLAVYTGNSLASLTPVASDDDSGGFLTSRVVFNAVQGAEYQIAIDGFNGAAADLVFSWSLVSATDALPRIVIEPESQAVAAGEDVTVRVVAASLTPVSYQWRFNCSTLLGQTNDTVTIHQVGPAQVGVYSVEVSNVARTIESQRATLQVNFARGAVVKAFARDKLAETLTPSSGLAREGLTSSRPAVRPQAVSLAQGTAGLQIFSTFGATKEPGEPNHCGVAGGASYWFTMQAESDGLLTVNTEGSDFDTVLAVYTWAGTSFDSLALVACDDNSGCDGLTSFLRFAAKAGTIYHIAVDGVNGETGTVRLAYALDGPNMELTPLRSSASNLPLSTFEAHFRGTAGRSYRLQASSDLVRWHSLLTTNLGSASLFQFTDPNLLRLPYYFYRVIPVP